MKKGFTLIELIAVIGIISIILLFAVPSYTLISNRIKETMYEESIYQDLIKEQYKKLYIAAAGMFEE